MNNTNTIPTNIETTPTYTGNMSNYTESMPTYTDSNITNTTPYTTQPLLNDITQSFPNISSDNIISLLNSGIDLMKLYSDKNYMSEKGMNFDSQMKGPTTNIYQKNFSGTSNVYSPYLYYNKNKDNNKIPEPTNNTNTNTQENTTTTMYNYV